MAKFPCIKPGEKWTSPELVIGVYSDNTWHFAADRFSKWWHSWAKKPRIPQWLKSVGGLSLRYNFYEPDALDINKKSIDLMSKTMGITMGHTNAWLVQSTEAWYPASYNLSQENLKRFRQVTDHIRDNGGRLSVYTNPLMISRATAEYAEYGKDLAAIARDGTIWATEHTHRHHPMSLPYPNKIWAEKFAQAITPMVNQGKPDCLYMDQLGAVPSHIDFAPEKHGHKHYGQWIAGSVDFVKYITETFYPQNPELITMIEDPCPAIQQYVTLGLLNGNSVDRFVFPYYYNVSGKYADLPSEELIAALRESFLLGQPVLSLGIKDDIGEEFKAVMALKKQIDPLLYEAIYRDIVGIKLSDKNVQAAIYKKSDGTLYIPVVNVKSRCQLSIDLSKYKIGSIAKAKVMLAQNLGVWKGISLTKKNQYIEIDLSMSPATLIVIEKASYVTSDKNLPAQRI